MDAVSCESAAWFVIQWAVDGPAFLAWCAINLGLAAVVLFCAGKLKWVK